MGEHDAPVNFLSRWNETEPLRLYLYGITVPVLGLTVVYGWANVEQAGAWLAVAGALFVSSTVAGELARRRVTSPQTVDDWLNQVHAASYARGMEDATPAGPEQVAAATTAMAQVRPAERCRHIENGRRCVLDTHGKETPHHYG